MPGPPSWTGITHRPTDLNVQADSSGNLRIVDAQGNTFQYPHNAMNLTDEWVLDVVEFMRRKGEDGGLTPE